MVTVYHPPQNNDFALRNHLFQSLDSALARFPNSGIVILGDFNQFNPGSLISSFSLKQMVNKPTRGRNILDKIYTTLSKYYDNVNILPPIGQSDHSCVFLNSSSQHGTYCPPVYTTKRDCKPANKRALVSALSTINWTPLYHSTSLDNQFALFSKLLSSTIATHLPLRTCKVHSKDKPWITEDIKKTISKRQNAWSSGYTLKYNFYRNKVRKLCKSSRKSYYDKNILNTQEPNPQKWWKNVKAIAGLTNSEPLSSIFHDGEFKSGPELAELIADSFCNVASSLPSLQFSKVSVDSVPDEFIVSPNQVATELEKISLQKATGPDDIPNWVLKTCSPLLARPICSIFNASIAQGSIPALWKCADVLPLPKVPKPKSVDSDLRPISLTPVLSKLLEGFVFRWLFNHIKPSIDHLQFGNIKNCSTTHALIHLIHNWLVALDNPGTTIRSCMIDFSKAFDRIDHNILLQKLQMLDTPPILLNWCANFLQDRYLRVKLGQNKSSWRRINAGVPQGTRLGPLFFLVMINDLETNLPIYKYVDDCTIYEIVSRSSPNSSLQSNIDTINDWTERNNMRLNVSKTKELRVSFLKDSLLFDTLSSSSSDIEIVEDFKLLGVTISSNLSWNTHVNNICVKASKRLYALRVLKRSGAPAKDLVTVYCAFIRPVLEYACQVWHFSLPQCLSNQIEHIQQRALKIAFPQLSYAASLDCTNLSRLHQRRVDQCQSLYKNVHRQSDNKLRDLLPETIAHNYNLRNPRSLPLVKCRTERFRNSFVPKCVSTWDKI